MMKSALLMMGMLSFGSDMLAAQTIPPQPVEGKIDWVYTYAEGQKRARETGKPLFVVFRCER